KDAQMKRLTAYVSGKIQTAGYRSRVIQTANTLGLKGIVESLSDGRVKIIAEGDEDKLRWFEEAIDIKNTLIQVSTIKKDYSQAIGEFSSFSKLVGQGETDSRLDQGVEILRDILVAVKDMNTNLGGKVDLMLEKQDQTIEEIKGLRADQPSFAMQG
ncbi:MAG TPA: acylphosphatase, partial [Methanotrichaceae archaeon]|nr:acylphosphatase [Methanotrichaceae archaeon]